MMESLRLVLNLLYLLATGSFLLTALLLFTKPKTANKRGTRYLAIFLVLLSLVFLEECLRLIGLAGSVPLLEELLGIPLFALGPMFYFSVLLFVQPDANPGFGQIIHLLPCALYVFVMGTLWWVGDPSVVGISPQITGAYLSVGLTLFLITQVSIYFLLSFRLLRRHRQNVRLFAADEQFINLLWLQRLMAGIALLVLLWFSQICFPSLPDLTSIGYFCASFYLAFFSINQPEIFLFTPSEQTSILKIIQAPKNQKTIFDPLREHEKQRLNLLMTTQKPYLDNELSLPKLAHLFQSSTHHLSHLLNDGFGENFYDYVNRFRVEESKLLLSDPRQQHLNMLGIASAAGFNSKTSFNTAFKKVTGVTPSAFRRAGM